MVLELRIGKWSPEKDPEETVSIALFQIPGLVNVDSEDVKEIMKDFGTAMLGVGVSSSKNRAEEAAEQATILCRKCPSISGFLQVVTSLADPSANITFGAVVDDLYTGEIHVTRFPRASQSFQKTLLTDPRAAKLFDKNEIIRSSREQRNVSASPEAVSCNYLYHIIFS